MSYKTLAALLTALTLTACASDMQYQPPAVRIVAAQAQMTDTQAAAVVALIAPTSTAQAIGATATAQSIGATGTAHAMSALATEQAVSATGTAMRVLATESAANVTATAEWRATDAAVVWGLTQQALDEQAIRNSQLVGLMLTQTAGEARATAARLDAQIMAWYILFIGGALAAVIVIIGLAARVAGPSLAHAGEALAAQIVAHGKAYADGREADGQYALRASQGWAAREMARQGGAVAQRRAAIPQTPKPEMSAEIASALGALKACRDIVGGESRFLPKANELSGPVRAALEPMKGNGIISVTRGRGGGTYLTRHLTLDALIAEVEAGYIALEARGE